MTLRLLEGLVRRGWQVEWFSAAYPGAAPDEVRDGIRYVRAGGQASVHFWAYRRYAKAQPFDVVVDEINTIPFFTPLYFRIPQVALIYQLAREVWLHEAPAPLSWAGYALEPAYMQVYRRTPVATISPSSAQSFERLGLRGPRSIVPIAVDEPAVERVPAKCDPPAVTVIARIAPSKRIGDALRAARWMADRGWTGTLRIAGSGAGAYAAGLKAEAERILPGRVEFLGFVSDERRTSLLQESSALWMTSEREGWGLVVTEANRNGTPAVVYDVPGLRDAVANDVTGYVVSETPEALGAATLRLFARANEFAERALAASRHYDWERSVDAFEDAVRATMTAYAR